MLNQYPKWLTELDILEENANNHFDKKEYAAALKKYLELINRYTKLKANQRSLFNYLTKRANIHIQLGRCYKHLDQHTESVTQFVKALSACSDRLDARYELACAAHSGKDFKTAKENAHQVINANRRNYDKLEIVNAMSFEELRENSYCLLANIAEAEGNISELKIYCEKAGKYSKLAEIALKEEKYDEAALNAKKAISTLTNSNAESLSLAYYYWAMSFIKLLKNKLTYNKELTQAEEQKVIFAISLMEKACASLRGATNLASKDKALIFFEAALLAEAKTRKQDHAKAVALYRQAIAEGMPQAMHNLGLKYEQGDGIDKNEKEAFELYLQAAKLGFAKAQTDLARCYVNEIGCEINFKEAKSWAKKAASTIPLAKHYLACFMWNEAIADNNRGLGQKAIELFSEAAEGESLYANLNLGKIYHFSLFVEQNFALAENYYRQAIRLGCTEAMEFLLTLGFDVLTSSSIGDANYTVAESTCREILEEYYGEKILTGKKDLIIAAILGKIKVEQKKEFSIFVATNKRIRTIYDDGYLTSEEKIAELLNTITPEKANIINLSTTLLRFGELLDECKLSSNIFKQHREKINLILDACEKKLTARAFSIRSLCNLTTGLCKLYRHGYLSIMEELLKNIFEELALENSSLLLIDIASILAAACRTNLRANLITPHLQSVINRFLKDCENHIEHKENLSSIFYSLAMLDNYARLPREFKLIIDKNLIRPLLCYAIDEIDNKSLRNEDRHAYFLAALYFSHTYHGLLDPSSIAKLQKLSESKDFNSNSTHRSELQGRVYAFISSSLGSQQCIEEFPVNTLPVDIRYKNHLIQVNGPHHYVIINENGGHIKSAKDELHTTLLNCHFDEKGQPLSNSRYLITEIDYREYKKQGNDYVRSALAKNGLTLANPAQSTASFRKAPSPSTPLPHPKTYVEAAKRSPLL